MSFLIPAPNVDVRQWRLFFQLFGRLNVHFEKSYDGSVSHKGTEVDDLMLVFDQIVPRDTYKYQLNSKQKSRSYCKPREGLAVLRASPIGVRQPNC